VCGSKRCTALGGRAPGRSGGEGGRNEALEFLPRPEARLLARHQVLDTPPHLTTLELRVSAQLNEEGSVSRKAGFVGPHDDANLGFGGVNAQILGVNDWLT